LTADAIITVAGALLSGLGGWVAFVAFTIWRDL
jgi:hypothetical protein